MHLSQVPMQTIEFKLLPFEILLFPLFNTLLQQAHSLPQNFRHQYPVIWLGFYHVNKLIIEIRSMEANASASETVIGSRVYKERLSSKINHPELDYKNKFVNENLQRKSLHSSSLFQPKTPPTETLIHSRKPRKDFDTLSMKEENVRGYSLRNGNGFKGNRWQNNGERGLHDYNEELLKLKLEEMIFKFKTRIGALLKEIDISVTELGRFTSLNRIDQILDFLSEKVRARLFKKDANQSNTDRLRVKEQELLGDYEIQIEALKRKQQEREGIQKGYKVKLRQAHNEIRDLYDRINQKERELSLKMTEIYQIKSVSKESQKLIDNYKHKCLQLEREVSELKEKQSSQSKKQYGDSKRIEEQNAELAERNEELSDLLERQAEKEEKILQLNHHLQEELERWRERFESERIGESETVSQSLSSNKQKNIEPQDVRKLERKISNLSLGNQLDRLNYKVKELEKQNRSLLRELSSYTAIKQKYEELKSCMDVPGQPEPEDEFVADNQQKSGQLSEGERFELEYNCRKKIEEVAKQWKDKLIQIVNNYDVENDQHTKQMEKLRKDNEQLEAKVYQLANQKYLVENKLIEKDRELAELNRVSKRKSSNGKIQKAESESKSQTISEQKQKKVKSQVG